MKVEIVPLPAIQLVEQAIVIGGKTVGIVKPALHAEAYYKHHIILNSEHGWNIYQGFGNTIDEAMRDAVNTAKSRRRTELTELDELENIIWGDHEFHE
jgi:hypothetical protein